MELKEGMLVKINYGVSFKNILGVVVCEKKAILIKDMRCYGRLIYILPQVIDINWWSYPFFVFDKIYFKQNCNIIKVIENKTININTSYSKKICKDCNLKLNNIKVLNRIFVYCPNCLR